MSVHETCDAACPQCGAAISFDYWSSLNAGEDPARREELFDARLNRLACACGFETLYFDHFLYVDTERAFMVMYKSAATAEEYAEWRGGFDTMVAEEAMPATVLGRVRLRLVDSLPALLETILMLESGLDDRVVRILKLVARLQDEESGAPQGAWYFSGTGPGGEGHDGEYLQFLVYDDEGEATGVGVGRVIYDDVSRLWAAALESREDATGHWILVDDAYGMEVLTSGSPDQASLN